MAACVGPDGLGLSLDKKVENSDNQWLKHQSPYPETSQDP
jgi:hypothetical protein